MTATPSLLDGIDLVVFDKDGTLIDLHAMWGTWAAELASRLGDATGRPVDADVHRTLGTDPRDQRVAPEAPVAVASMARLRELMVDVAVAHGATPSDAEAAVQEAWFAPDPVAGARPLADLAGLFGELRAGGRRIAVVTADDRGPTEATLAALGLAHLVDALVCADDGLPLKPAPDMLLHACGLLDVPPGRTAMVGDTATDLQMARGAGAGLVIGVLSGGGERDVLAPLADRLIQTVGDLAAWR